MERILRQRQRQNAFMLRAAPRDCGFGAYRDLHSRLQKKRRARRLGSTIPMVTSGQGPGQH